MEKPFILCRETVSVFKEFNIKRHESNDMNQKMFIHFNFFFYFRKFVTGNGPHRIPLRATYEPRAAGWVPLV
jgi:hypothetical protein